jgi:hypothetical protein
MTRYQPQIVNHENSSIRVVLAYKNFAVNRNISHIGLGVAAINTSKTLRSLGYWVDVWPCTSGDDLHQKLQKANEKASRCGEHPVSHVIVSAPWIPTRRFQELLIDHTDVKFALVSHSNIGFLMADPNGIQMLREGIELEAGYHNFTLAGNSEKFCQAWEASYQAKVTWLPNLYDLSSMRHVGHRQPWHRGHVLRVGIFGATRPLKNMVTAASAAVQLATTLKNDVEIYLSSGREEGGGSVKAAIKQLTRDVPGVTLVENPWSSWPSFRKTVGHMHVLLNVSYTESFNMVCADGIGEGVASVVSEAIDWAPQDWQANVDDVGDVARVARRLLHDHQAVLDGQEALKKYVKQGSHAWENYLRGA